MPAPTADVEPALADTAAALERTLAWVRRAVRPTEWSAVALATLDAVDRLGPMRVTELTARERITQPGMTGLVARLAAAGLVERRSDPTDGRATLVTVTDAGRDYLGSIRRLRAETLADHIGRLSPAEQSALRAAVPALRALAEQPVGTAGIT